jgi:DNA-binding NtrC family response regulator
LVLKENLMADAVFRAALMLDAPLVNFQSDHERMTAALNDLCHLIDQRKSSEILPTVFLLASDRKHLKLAAGPKVPEAWKQALKNLEFPSNASFRSAGAYPGKAVWIADLRCETSLASCRQLGARKALVAAWAVPVFAGDGGILGALVLFSQTADSPGDEDLKLVQEVLHMAASAIEGHCVVRADATAPSSFSETLADEALISNVGGMIGGSVKMQHVYRMITRMSEQDCPVLILGESGTGKELAARATHNSGSRRGKPFIPVDCSALVPTLIEAELFGYSRGAFTGATQSKTGLMQAAGDGTLFLDEIGDLPLGMQSKLLRVLQEKELRRIGSTACVPLHARIIAATNQDLETSVRQGTFRQDLFFRLNVVQIRLPPLRERKMDIAALVGSFIEKFGGSTSTLRAISEEASTCLMAHDWPGNVRELANSIQRAIALGLGPILMRCDLPWSIRHGTNERSSPKTNQPLPLEQLTRREILRALHASEGNMCVAARALGIGKSTIYRKLREYNADI